eukprot:PhM_4_TR2807/c0_g1_i1/m.67200
MGSLQSVLIVLLCVLVCLVFTSTAAVESYTDEYGDAVSVEDVADVPPVGKKKRPTAANENGSEKKSSSSSSSSKGSTSSSGRRKRPATEQPPLEYADLNSFSLVQDIEKILGMDKDTPASAEHTQFVDSDVLKEFDTRHDDVKAVLAKLQRATKSSDEDGTLVYDVVPKRLQRYKAIITAQRRLQQRVLSAYVDVCGAVPKAARSKAQQQLHRYADSTLRQGRLASQRNLHDMVSGIKQIRASWRVGLTWREWQHLSAGVAVSYVFWRLICFVSSMLKVSVVTKLLATKQAAFPILCAVVVSYHVPQLVAVQLPLLRMLAVCTTEFFLLLIVDGFAVYLLWGQMLRPIVLSIFGRRRAGGVRLGTA